MPLNRYGLKFVADNVQQAQRAVDSVRKKAEDAQKAIKKASEDSRAAQEAQWKAMRSGGKGNKAWNEARKAQDKATKSMEVAKQKTNEANHAMKSMGTEGSRLAQILGPKLAGNITKLAGSLGPLAIAIAAVTAAMYGLYRVGINIALAGERVDQTAGAFGNIVKATGDATDTLRKLRASTRGAIDDLRLMQLTVTSLAGTTEEFRKVVAPELGKIIDITSRAAVAMGENEDVIREKFLKGLRRQRNALVDDIGVQVDATEANRKYAEQLGITAAQLTETQQQAAWAADAISQLDRISEEIGGKNTLAEYIGRVRAGMKNLIAQFNQTIGRVLTPIFKFLMEVIDTILQEIQPFMDAMKEIGAVFARLTTRAQELGSKGLGFLREQLQRLKPVALAVYATILILAEAIEVFVTQAIQFWTALLGGMKRESDKSMKAQQDSTRKFILDMAEMLAFGGTAIIAGFASGLMQGATYVLKAVNSIADIVADFLMGFSPPKKGPLHNIDKGGIKTIQAWVGGMLGAVVEPIESVAGWVAGRMGKIASMSLAAIEARLGVLDSLLKPFKEKVEIVKADFEAITSAFDPATRMLERQRTALLKQLEGGALVDMDKLRAQDRAILNMQKMRDAQQEMVDQAELQYQFARAQQIQERTMLELRKEAIGTVKKEKAKAPKLPKAAGGAAAPPTLGEDDGAFGGLGTAPELGGTLGAEIQQMKEDLQAAFGKGKMRALDLVDLGSAQKELGKERRELSKSVDRISRGFDTLGPRLQERFVTPFENAFNTIREKLNPENWLLRPLRDGLRSAQMFVQEKLLGPDSIAAVFSRLPQTAIDAITTIGNFLTSTAEKGALTLPDYLSLTKTIVSNALSGSANSVLSIFKAFTDVDLPALFSIGSVIDTLFASTAGRLHEILESAKGLVDTALNFGTSSVMGLFKAVFGDVGSVFGLFDVGSAFRQIFATGGPLEQAMSDMAWMVGEGMKKAMLAILNPVEVAADALELPGVLNAARAATSLVNAIGGKARGGPAGGSFLAGENGPELITMNGRGTVFPAAATRALQMMASREHMGASSGGGMTINNTYNNQRTTDMSGAQFNATSPRDALTMYNQQLAFAGY